MSGPAVSRSDHDIDVITRDFNKSDTYARNALNLCQDLAASICLLNKDAGDGRLEELRSVTIDLCRNQLSDQLYMKACTQVFNQMREDGESECDVETLIREKMSERVRDGDVSHSSAVQDFDCCVKQALSTDDDVVDDDDDADDDDNESGGDMMVDDDVAMSRPKPSLRCPYTGQEMVDPVRNKQCGHSYDLQGILTLIKHKANKARCPVSGCVNEKVLTRSDLETNEELKKLLKNKNKKKN